jgi:uncharacterized protein (TIGR03435 family)
MSLSEGIGAGMAGRMAGKLTGGWRLMLLVVAMHIAVPAVPCQLASGNTAQTDIAAPKLPAYDVVSIKLNKSGSSGVNVNSNDNRYSASNLSLKDLLEDAYGIKKDLISGVTGPIASARFDVEAKIVDRDPDALKKLSGRQYGQMLMPFLMERFQLKAHTETKILPVYELVVAKGGPKFKPAEDEKRGSGTSIQGGHNGKELTAHNISMEHLASSLMNEFHRTVIDKTGLAGNYDLAMKWSTEDETTQTEASPLIFTALQEQLGLKLQPGKGPVDTLVVDSVEMPSEN